MAENIPRRAYKADEPWPIGVWVRLDLPSPPGLAGRIWFTYVDPQKGFSASSVGPAKEGGEDMLVIARPPWPGITCTPLSDDEIQALSLPARPNWLEFYGPQPEPGSLWGIWRNDPVLKGKFHPEYPDDIQVIVHEGGRRFAKHPPEGMWVRVTGSSSGVYAGVILNAPFGLTNVRQGSVIKFVMPQRGPHPIMVTDKYLEERDHWVIHPCDKCRLAELYDAPSDFLRAAFPDTPNNEVHAMFSYKCGGCPDGFQIVENKDIPQEATSSAPRTAGKKPWQFWK